MASSPSDNFAKMFMPEHPHLRLHVLLSILAFSIVAGSITLYQISKVEKSQLSEFSVPVVQHPTGLTLEERNQILSNLQEQVSKSPPISEAQRKQIIENLKQAVTQENK